MADFLMGLLKSTVEYQNWGYNALTFSAIGTFLFTFLQMWSFGQQNKRIWSSRSGEAVSVPMFSYWLFYWTAFLIYGVFGKSIAIVFNSLMFLTTIPILLGLYKFKGFVRREKILFGIFSLIPVAMFYCPQAQKPALLLALLMGVLFSIALQPYEIWQKKSAGSVEPKLLVVFAVTAVFWFAYGIITKDIPLMIFNPLAIVVLLITLGLWRKYRKHEKGEG